MSDVEDRLREIRERWDDVERVTGVGRPDDEDGFGWGTWWDAGGESVECRWWSRKGRGRALRAPTDIAYLLAEIDRLRAVAQDWLNAMDFDGVECSCGEGDPCPRCRCVEALGQGEV